MPRNRKTLIYPRKRDQVTRDPLFGPLGQIKKCSEPGPGSYIDKKKKGETNEEKPRADWNHEKKVSYMVKHINSKMHIPGPGLNGSLKKPGWDEMKQNKK